MTETALTGFGATSAREALAVISRTQLKPVRPGTDSVLSIMALRLARPEEMIASDAYSVRLSYVRLGPGELRIGSLTTRSQLLTSPHIAAHCELLLDAVRAHPSPGPGIPPTIGAALCRPGAPDGIASALIALRAIVVSSGRDRRMVSVSEFRRRRGVLGSPGDLVLEVRIPLRAVGR
jgi:aerobic carbon-monoxide dehydrogenase medium subunit